MKFAVLVFPGLTCDLDMYHAVEETVKQEVEYVWHTEADRLGQFDALLLPTGTSYGNYLRPGALAKSSPACQELQKFAESGKLVLGVGNGFHILVEAGILPGGFLRNNSLKFRSAQVKLQVENTSTAFTKEYSKGQKITLPVANEFGNYYADEATVEELKSSNRIIFTYAGENEDGSTAAIAGITNEKGNVLGMMPLPERAVEELIGGTDGAPIFHSILNNWSEKHVN
ncbi:MULTISPECIES: phosphoribosylformylglycinamidine synthase subunit PurQ [Sporosarcina]|uniref:phosphoribosylformylglycinamidine synthase subunit PurQ n=1 Tax=Sporosarcina TaxID=1569 RepID=UPI00129BBEA3|nr:MULTISPECIES: phosphoribosylformylglycinamidine synthase subunit PurQ [Sporosarcina]GKV67022.1 phosphoribosylformylglycinamidine synthase subunit PurQ [Sporosarcina sp. NCCP-2331]GLB57352.1 phosphoribosylformylglycinamidine synthase subunit PurQ [Sporosarcina sp. NCCP-2378]